MSISLRTKLSVGLCFSFAVCSLVWPVSTLARELRAQDPTRWERSIRAFEAEEAESPPPQGAIVFVGSSSVRMWHATIHDDLAPLSVIARGFGGSTMDDALYYVDRLVLKHRPRAVVLYEGDNDLGNGSVSPEELSAGYDEFVARVHEVLPETRIYFLAVKPSLLRWDVWPDMQEANALIEATSAEDPRLMFVDVASPMLDATGEPKTDIFIEDGLHMNEKGYEIWTSVVRPLLLEHEGRFEEAGP